MIIIFAPHVDDELIGCWSLFTKMGENRIVAYCELPDPERRNEAWASSKEMDFEILTIRPEESLHQFVHRVFEAASNRVDRYTCWAPDPHWELHPLHKVVGTLVHEACNKYFMDFGTYSTNMNVPYLRELNGSTSFRKREALDKFYPSQKSLWEQDHRYWLFEGLSLWNPRD